MVIDLDISEASSEIKEILCSPWIWEACILLVKLRKTCPEVWQKHLCITDMNGM